MKKTLIILLIFIDSCLMAQYVKVNNDAIAYENEILVSSSSLSSTYGNAFTPRGEFKVLLIFVNFNNPNESNPNNHKNWPANQEYPNWYLDNSFIYNSLSDFNNTTPENPYNLSYYFYQMSKQLPQNDRFKIYANSLAVNIELDANDKSWDDLTAKAYDAMVLKYPNINSILSGFDSRKNSSHYAIDNRNTLPDGKVDYAIIMFRYDSGWKGNKSPLPGMEDWWCSSGAYAGIKFKNFGSIKIADGYTQPPGMGSLGKVFTHEMAHNIFSAPHYGNCNNITGKYFRSNSLWGIMPTVMNEIYSGANAWERWYLGYIDIKHDLKNSLQNGIYVLKDYLTTGEAIRIKLPYVNDQYLWLENHQKISPFDEKWTFLNSKICDIPTPSSPKGLMAYVESIADSHNEVHIFNHGANGLRLLNADGNYDFSEVYFDFNDDYYNMCEDYVTKGEPNPYEGYNIASKFFFDHDNDGTIELTTNGNTAVKKQGSIVYNVTNDVKFGSFGRKCAFQVGDKIGIGTNPPIVNMREYNEANHEMAPIYLNGISIEVLDRNTVGDLTLKILFNDYSFSENIRMCGNVILPPSQVNLNESKIINLNKSGTPNRNTKINGEFVNPTRMSTSNSTNLILEKKSKIKLNDKSTLNIESNSSVLLQDDAEIIVNSGNSLILNSETIMKLNDGAKIKVYSGGFLCVDQNVTINLNSKLSTINLYPGSNLGVNPLTNTGCNCISSFTTNGVGKVVTYNTDLYLQNETINYTDYLAHNNIFIGSNVTSSKSPGPVVIQNGSKLHLDVVGEVLISGELQVDLGGELIIDVN
jgi:hypothetical protein